MKTNLGMFLIAISIIACGQPAEQPPAPSKTAPPVAESAAKKVEAGKSISLEIPATGPRRVHIEGEVSFREGPLEMLMCRKNTKEHESLIAGDFDARDIHKALLATGAVNGSPVKFEPKYTPALGTPIKIFLRYIKDGKETTVNAREWVRETKTQKPLAIDWVFGGSFFYPDHEDAKKPQRYAANSGDVICVSNFGTAMLDLPIESSATAADLAYQAFTERIPPLGTKVTVILEPQLEKKN